MKALIHRNCVAVVSLMMLAGLTLTAGCSEDTPDVSWDSTQPAKAESALETYPPSTTELEEVAAHALINLYGISEPEDYLDYATVVGENELDTFISTLVAAGRIHVDIAGVAGDLIQTYGSQLVALEIPDVITEQCAIASKIMVLPLPPDEVAGVVIADGCSDQDQDDCENMYQTCGGVLPGSGFGCDTCICTSSCFNNSQCRACSN